MRITDRQTIVPRPTFNYLISNVTSILCQLSGPQYISIFDLVSAFHQISMDPGNLPKTVSIGKYTSFTKQEPQQRIKTTLSTPQTTFTEKEGWYFFSQPSAHAPARLPHQPPQSLGGTLDNRQTSPADQLKFSE